MGKSWIELIGERETLLGTDTIARMARIFIDNSKSQLATIEAAAARRALGEARRAAHDLAANAESLCFHHLRLAAQDLENACVGADRRDLSALAAPLAPLVEMTAIQLRARYNLK